MEAKKESRFNAGLLAEYFQFFHGESHLTESYLLSLNKDEHLQFSTGIGSARCGSGGSTSLFSETRALLSLNNPDPIGARCQLIDSFRRPPVKWAKGL